MKISIEASLNRDCRNTRRANICLYSRMLLEFSGCEYICGGNLVTYLSVTRARVRAMYVSAAYRLSTYLVDRINRRNQYTLYFTTTIFNQQKEYFIRQARTILPRIGLCVRAIRLFQHCNYLPNSSHANSNYPLENKLNGNSRLNFIITISLKRLFRY